MGRMRPPRSLQLLVTVILSLVLFTTCLARPTHEFITGASRVSGSIRAEDKALETIQLGGRVSNFLKPRSVGFQEYLDIGSGWNMYYSSWPSIALPVRKYISVNVFGFSSSVNQTPRHSCNRHTSLPTHACLFLQDHLT